MSQEPSVGAQAAREAGRAAGQSMCFPSQTWELRSELAGQGDPRRLPALPRQETQPSAVVTGSLELRLEAAAAPTTEDPDFRPSLAGVGVGCPCLVPLLQ